MTGKIKLTLLEDLSGSAPGKAFILGKGEGGKPLLKKVTRGSRIEFTATVLDVTLAELAEIIAKAPPTAHLCSGTAEYPAAHAVTVGRLAQHLRKGETADGDGRPYITFSNADLQHRAGQPGLMVVDTDDLDDAAAESESVIGELTAAVPALAAYARIAQPSSGSCIYNLADTGSLTQLRGIRGLHTYFAVADAADIPRALTALHQRLVLAGRLRARLAKTGAFLERSAVDRAMRVPSQPVFLKAHVDRPLIQHKAPTYIDGIPLIDTARVIPSLTADEMKRYAGIVLAERERLLPEARATHAAYVAKRVVELVETGVAESVARTTILASMHGGYLTPQFPVTLSDGTTTTVATILADPDKWQGTTCRDPLEPDYGSATVAKIFTSGGRPVIHSFAHGGRTFQLGDLADDFDDLTLGDAGEMFEKAEREAIQRTRGDEVLMAWLQARVATAKTVLAEGLTAEAVALALIRRKLDLSTEVPPGIETFDAMGRTGLGIRVTDKDGTKLRLVIGIAKFEELLREWRAHDLDAALVGWAALAAEHTTVDGLEDQRAAALLKSVGSILKLPAKAAKDALVAAHDRQERMLSAAWAEAQPATESEKPAARDPEAEAAAKLRQLIAREREIQGKAGDIPADPIAAFRRAMAQVGVEGEHETALFCYLIITSAHLDKPASAVIRGPSGSGKSHLMKSVARLFPPEAIYRVSSMSARSLVYEPGGFEHRTILLEEAEALVRVNKDDKNDVAEMLRVMLSEGQLIHKVVVRNPATDAFETVTHTANGPTNLLTSTTRSTLDPELMTRLIDHWTDIRTPHQESVLKTLGNIADGSHADRVDVEQWHAFAEYVRLAPRAVIVPFAGTIAASFSTAGGSRTYRDFNSLMALTRAACLMHRAKRQIDEQGRLLAQPDDYRAAYSIMGERIDELSGEKVPADVMTVFNKVKPRIVNSMQGCSTPTWSTTLFECAALLGCSRNRVMQVLNRVVSNGLVVVERSGMNRASRLLVSLADDYEKVVAGTGKALIHPDVLDIL